MRTYESNYVYEGEIEVENMIAEVRAEASGWYQTACAGNPPDGECTITDIDFYWCSYTDKDCDVEEITDEIKEKFKKALMNHFDWFKEI